MMDNHFKHKIQQHKVDWDKEALWEELAPQLPKPKPWFKRYWWVVLPLLLIPACWHQLPDWQQVAPAMMDEPTRSESNLQVTSSKEAAVNAEPLSRKSGALVDELERLGPSSTINDVTERLSLPLRQHEAYEQPAGSTDAMNVRQVDFNPPSSPLVKGPQMVLELDNGAQKSLVLTKQRKSQKIFNPNTVWNFPSGSFASMEQTLPLKRLPSTPVSTITATPAINPAISSTEVSLTRPLKSKQQGAFVNVLGGAGSLERQDDFTAIEPAIVEYRKEHTDRLTPQLSWNAQVEAGYRHHSGFSLSTGLGYGQVREQFSFDGVVRVDTFIGSDDRARYYVKPSGDTLFLTGPGVYTQLVNRQVLHNNRLSYYQIPILLGYHIPKNRWDIEVTAGVNYLLRSQYRGRVSERFPATIVDDPALTLRNRWGYNLRIGAQYELLPATYLYVNTEFRQSPEFIRTEVGQRYRSFGLQLGLQYRL